MTPETCTWRRGGLASLVLAFGLALVFAAAGRSEEPKKAETPKPKADDKAKPDAKDEKPEAKPPVKEVNVGPPSGGHPATDLVNKELAKFWAANSVRPSAKATDYEFVRRVYLDIIGRTPAIWEVKAYVADTDTKNKRAKLISKLLNDVYYKGDYEANWADIWTTLLLTRSGNRTYHEQMNLFLEEEFGKNRPWDQLVRTLLTATGRTDDKGEVNFVLSHLGEPQRNRGEEGQFDAVPITSRSARLFLGVQIQCAQCHDHPFNPEWKQSHFWGVNAFFRQVERDGQPNMQNQRNQMAAQLTLKDNKSFNSTDLVYFEDRDARVKATSPKFLDGKILPPDSKKSRRELLADYVLGHELFPKAMVNRMWGRFFGRGLCQQPTVDDFGEHNQVNHPEILDGLARQFKEYKYDMKELISWICNSEAYALSCVANNTNSKPEHEPYFSRMLLKNLSPEQLFDALKTAMDQPEQVKKTIPGAKPKKPGLTRVVDENRKRQREEWLAKLTRNFGDDEGNEVTFNGTVVQALLLMNGRELQTELSRKDNNTILNAIAKGKSPRGILNELTLAALGRLSTEKEWSLINREKYPGNPIQFWEDVFWALMNSNEFVLNH